MSAESSQYLRAMVERVRVALGDSTSEGIALSYQIVGNTWMWFVHVADRLIREPDGRQWKRHGFCCSGATAELAVANARLYIAVASYLTSWPRQRRRAVV